MFLRIIENLERVENLIVPHRGLVLDNQDPKKLGRVKCFVKGILEGTPSSLPWVAPIAATGLGGGGSLSGFAVPNVGSELVVTFLYGEVYFPVYNGYWQTQQTHQSLFDDNYPASYGFRDETGNFLKVNRAVGSATLHHGPSGVQIVVDHLGNITITGGKGLSITHSGDLTVNSGGNVIFNTTGTFRVAAATVDLNP